MSKGSGRRPKFISDDEFASNWERTLGRKLVICERCDRAHPAPACASHPKCEKHNRVLPCLPCKMEATDG